MSSEQTGHDALTARLESVDDAIAASESAATDDEKLLPPATDSDFDRGSATTHADSASRDDTDDVEERVASLDERLTALEADLDAVRGLLDGVEAIDEAVERRASIALAKVEALERQVEREDGALVRERFAESGETGDGDTPAESKRDETRHAVGKSTTAETRTPNDAVDDADARPSTPQSRQFTRGGDRARDGQTVRDAVSRSEGASTETASDADPSLASRLRDAFR
jgi:hypothetical protein